MSEPLTGKKSISLTRVVVFFDRLPACNFSLVTSQKVYEWHCFVWNCTFHADALFSTATGIMSTRSAVDRERDSLGKARRTSTVDGDHSTPKVGNGSGTADKERVPVEAKDAQAVSASKDGLTVSASFAVSASKDSLAASDGLSRKEGRRASASQQGADRLRPAEGHRSGRRPSASQTEEKEGQDERSLAAQESKDVVTEVCALCLA